jgi:hypothetical protein
MKANGDGMEDDKKDNKFVMKHDVKRAKFTMNPGVSSSTKPAITGAPGQEFTTASTKLPTTDDTEQMTQQAVHDEEGGESALDPQELGDRYQRDEFAQDARDREAGAEYDAENGGPQERSLSIPLDTPKSRFVVVTNSNVLHLNANNKKAKETARVKADIGDEDPVEAEETAQDESDDKQVLDELEHEHEEQEHEREKEIIDLNLRHP